LVTLTPARAVIEEIQKLLEEANGIMHDDLNAQLGNVALAEFVEGSETTQIDDIGQGVRIEQVRICPRCPKRNEPCWTWSFNEDFTDDVSNCAQACSPKIKVRQLSTPDYVTTMAAIYGMLQQDFSMQVS